MTGFTAAEACGAAEAVRSTEQPEAGLTAAPSAQAATLSRFDPDPCRGRAAFALMGEFNLLIAGHQANCVAQQRYALDCNPIHRGDHIAFGEPAMAKLQGLSHPSGKRR